MIKIISLPLPTLQDNTADADRLKEALKRELKADGVDIDFPLLKILPDLLRKAAYRLQCVLINSHDRWRVIHIAPADRFEPVAGLAVDLGTTRISLRLLNLLSGKTIADTSFINPQVSLGADILTRVHQVEKENGLVRLNEKLISGLNRGISKICSANDITPDHILTLSVAGNTAMTHFFMGLNPRWIIREPYIPVVNSPGFLSAAALGVKINPHAQVYVFPNIGSYFGGDLIAGILFSGMHRGTDVSILVDVGTNAEVVIGNRDWMVACAGAAGPALEGGVTRMGMLAGPGVIDHVHIHPETKKFKLHTIGNLPPEGICGSGLIELAAQLFLSGMIDNRGKYVVSGCGSKLKEIEGIQHLEVVPADQSASGSDLLISQTSLDSLFRSKAAMFTVLETIISTVGMSFGDLSRFYVAGAFGSYINPAAAISIGMLPDIPLECFRVLGNSSVGGAAMMLKSDTTVEEIEGLRDRITYLELNVNQEFMNRFNAAKFLPHTDLSRFPSVKMRGEV